MDPSDLFLAEDVELDLGITSESIVSYVKENGDEISEEKADYILARKFLVYFIQQNFIGPQNDENCLPSDQSSIYCQKLIVDSEQPNVNIKNPELLYFSGKNLEALIQKDESNINYLIWYLRSIYIHQRILDGRTGHLYEKYKENAIKLEGKLENLSNFIKSVILLEITHGFMVFKRVHVAQQYLDKAKEVLKADVNLVSMLGYRTRFQTKPLPQMALKVESSLENLEKSSESHKETILPKLLRLDDDTRLEKIKFVEENDNKISDLPSILQCFILTESQFMEIAQVQDNLVEEELMAFMTTLLYQNHGPWSTRFATLLKNIKLEADNKRTVERSLKQCESLKKIIESTETPLNHRFSMFFCSGMAPIWGTEIQLGNLLMSLGFVKTALDIFIRIQSWDDVILCYNLLNLRHKAEEIIRAELEKNPTDKLYCLLGDATDDVSCYEKAWEFSNQRSAQAQKHWGNYLFSKKKYEESIPHFENSLEINSLQETLWLRLGFAALEMENWALAARAYSRYTQLEPNGFESWNNLAKAYIKMGDKTRAHKILNESLKCNFNNWKVWENFMVVSLDTGNFEDVLNAFKRLMELKNNFTDNEVLKIVMESIAQDVPDSKGVGSSRLKKKASTLLAELCVKFPSEGLNWMLAAKIYSDDLITKTQKLQKAFSAFGQSKNNWNKEVNSCMKMIDICLELGADTLNLISEDKSSLAVSQLASSRLALQGCVRAASSEKFEECKQPLTDLQQILDELTCKLKEIQLQK